LSNDTGIASEQLHGLEHHRHQWLHPIGQIYMSWKKEEEGG
jgi:hypothetical protein